MPTYSTSEVLEIIKSLTAEQKSELKQKILAILEADFSEPSATGASQSISGVNISGSSDIALNQTYAGGDSSVNRDRLNTLPQSQDLQSALMILENLKSSIFSQNSLNPLVKEIAQQEIESVQQELKQDTPNKSLVDQAISTLKKGLSGVEELAEPVMRVSALLAKAWVL